MGGGRSARPPRLVDRRTAGEPVALNPQATGAVNDRVTGEIRQIIETHGRLPVDVATLAPTADLYQAGLSSHASVNVMLALEDHFDIEFPDSMLTPSVFASIASIEAAVSELRSQTSLS